MTQKNAPRFAEKRKQPIATRKRRDQELDHRNAVPYCVGLDWLWSELFQN